MQNTSSNANSRYVNVLQSVCVIYCHTTLYNVDRGIITQIINLKPLHNIYYFYCVEMTDIAVNNGNAPLTYVANDWFYMKTGEGDTCNNTEDVNCVKNKSAVSNLQQSTNHLGASLTKYNDAKMLYNRELLFTVNILAGLMMLCYYIYLNRSGVLTSVNANNIKTIGNTITSSLTGANKLPTNTVIAAK